MEEQNQRKDTARYQVRGPIYDRTSNSWRLQLVDAAGRDIFTELDVTGRSINGHIGSIVEIEGAIGYGEFGELVLTVRQFKDPNAERRRREWLRRLEEMKDSGEEMQDSGDDDLDWDDDEEDPEPLSESA